MHFNDLSLLNYDFVIERGAARSYIGTQSKDKEITMWLNLSPRYYRNYKRTIRHEFGHALGLKHEHQHPDAPQQYNREDLVEYLREQHPEWSDGYIERTITSQWQRIRSSSKQLKGRYDRNSVMHYV